jgi:ABC-2 type transport system permease protein
VSWSRIWAILAKDLRDAMRDGRVVIVLLLPIAIAIYFAATTDDTEERPRTTVVVVDPGELGVAAALRERTARAVEVRTKTAPDADRARELVDADEAAFAVVVAGRPAGDEPARVEVLLPENATPTAQSVVGAVPDAVTAATGREPPVTVQTRALPVSAADQSPAELIDQRTLMIVISLVMLIAFVSLLVIPIQTAEEIETGTFGALRLAATGTEILAAKALNGLIYGVGGVVLVTVITGLEPTSWPAYVGACLLLLLSMVGFGLLLGLSSGNANQINTYGGFFLVPVIFLAVAVVIVDGGIFDTILTLIPFSAATELMLDATTPERPFDTGILSWLVLAVWTILGLLLVSRIATRREV